MTVEALSLDEIDSSYSTSEPQGFSVLHNGREWYIGRASPFIARVAHAVLDDSKDEIVEEIRASRDEHRDAWRDECWGAVREAANRNWGDVVEHVVNAAKEEWEAVKDNIDANRIRNDVEPIWHDNDGQPIERSKSGWPERCP